MASTNNSSSSGSGNQTKLSPTQKLLLARLSNSGGFIRLAHYARSGGNQFEYLSLVNKEFAESGSTVAKPSFQKLLATNLIHLVSGNPNDPFGSYYALSEAGKQVLKSMLPNA